MSQSRPTRFFALLVLWSLIFPVAAGWGPEKRVELELEAAQARKNFERTVPDLDVYFKRAHGYVLYPLVGKGGFWVGAAYGEGVVYEGQEPVGYSSMTQLTFGLQVGGQAYSEIIFFLDQAALERFRAGGLELGAHASAVAATAGSSAGRAFHEGVAVFTMVRGGLMTEASVGGQIFSFESK